MLPPCLPLLTRAGQPQLAVPVLVLGACKRAGWSVGRVM